MPTSLATRQKQIKIDRLQKIATLLLSGVYSAAEIARKIKCSPSVVRVYIKELQADWRQRANWQVDDYIQNELRKFEQWELLLADALEQGVISVTRATILRLKISDRRALTLGLPIQLRILSDKEPSKPAEKSPVAMTDAELEAYRTKRQLNAPPVIEVVAKDVTIPVAEQPKDETEPEYLDVAPKREGGK